MTAQREFIEAAIRLVTELQSKGQHGAGLEYMLDQQIESVIDSIIYKNGAATRRVNKLKKS